MAQGTPDIRVLVGVEGGASIDGKSGQLIAGELAKIANSISSYKTPQVAFTVNTQLTSQNITKQLNEIVKGIQVAPIDLNIRTNQSSIGTFAEDEYRKIIDGTKGNKSKANIATYIEEKRALVDIEVQKKKNEESTKKETNAEKERLSTISRIVDSQRLLNTAENNANKLGNTELTGKIQGEKVELDQLIQKLEAFYTSIRGSANLGEHINDKEIIELTSKIEACNKAAVELQKTSSKDNALLVKDERWAKQARDISDFTLSLEKFAKANDKFKGNSGLSTEFERISVALKDLEHRSKLGENVGVELDQLKAQTNNWKASLEAAGLSGQTAFGRIRAQMEKLGVYFGASAIMMGAWRQIKQMTINVIELDSAMTELKKVTNETDATYIKFLDNAEVRAKNLGATLVDTVNATADFSRLGYSLKEAESISDAALVYKNVGDGIRDINEASQSVISTMKAFHIEASQAMSIVDRFNETGNNFAISSKGVGDALLHSASALAVAGNDINQSIALITAGNEIVQDPDVVGNMLKTAALRLTSTKGQLEELGEDADGAAESITKLQTQLLNLTSGKVNIMLDSENFKSTYQIFLEMSQAFDSMTQKDKMEALEIMFGKHGVNVGASIIDNMSTAEKVLETSINSAGSALSENEKVLDSIKGKTAQFQAQYETLSNTIISSELIKGAVDSGSGLLGFLDSVIKNLGTIPTLATVAAGAISALSNKGGLAKNQWQHIICVESQRTYALCNLVETLNKPVPTGKRLHNKSLKWCA